jgi:hypothetical protein
MPKYFLVNSHLSHKEVPTITTTTTTTTYITLVEILFQKSIN